MNPIDSCLALRELTSVLGTHPEPQGFLPPALRILAERTGARAAAVYCLEPSGESLGCLASLGEPAALPQLPPAPALAQAMLDPAPILLDPVTAGLADSDPGRRLAVAPLRAELVAGLLVLNLPTAGADAEVLALPGLAADLLALALDRARAHAALRCAERERQAVLSLLSHDLRNPLTAVMTSTELLLRQELAPERSRDLIEAARRSGRQMDRLIHDLLDRIAARDAG